MAGSFEKTSIGWQWQLLQQRLGEWLERFFAPVDRSKLPHWAFPDWLLKLLFWVIVGLVLCWVSWQLYQVLRPYIHTPTARGQSRKVPPNQPTLTIAEWLQRSRTFARQGNYREACRALYMAALQRLHDADRISDESSRTDGEYLRLLQSLPNTAPYQVLIRTHEQICFGDADISAAMFDRCQQAYQEIDRT